jgi:hypothetical protein
MVFKLANFASLTLLALFSTLAAQTRTYPDKIRGYKVERTVVEVKKPKANDSSKNKGQSTDGQNEGATADESDVDQLIQFGQPEVARATPLGITFAVPIVVAPVTQKGHVDFLVFEDMVINGRSVEVSDYDRSFDLPNKDSLTLKDPLRIYIYLPNALLAAIGEWTDSKETWPVTGRVYVFGKFKKSVLGIPTSFKRCVPVELNLTMRNPLRER